MNESFLHYIWQFQYFSKDCLETVAGEPVNVFHPGHYNSHAGPDFSDARIKISDLEWRGSVEIHTYSSDWKDHGHNHDLKYENVILHVVWEDDEPVVRADGTAIPTLELNGRIDKRIIQQYQQLINNPETIPCSNSIQNVEPVIRLSMLEKTLIKRLEWRAYLIQHAYKGNSNDWEETAYQLLCRHLGFKTNAEPMESLSRAMPIRILRKHADRPAQVEALLYGQSGLLDFRVAVDEYSRILGREYSLLSHKYNLDGKRMSAAQWRFLRLRPANFPTIRIAQLASLIVHHKNLFSTILDLQSVKEAHGFFNISQSGYWCAHYHFGKQSSVIRNGMSKQSIYGLIINVVAPLLVSYGKIMGEQLWVDRAIHVLEELPAESNFILNKWKSLGFKITSASDSQALIELHNNSCLKRLCLSCDIGVSILRPDSRNV